MSRIVEHHVESIVEMVHEQLINLTPGDGAATGGPLVRASLTPWLN